MITMDILSFIGYVAGVIGFVAVLASAFIVVRSSTTKTTIENQKELIKTLLLGKEEQKDQITDLMNKHIEAVKATAALQGQVDVLRDVPLKKISDDMGSIVEEMKKLSQNQDAIAKALLLNVSK